MENKCRNPSFGLATKAKGLQGCEPKESPGVTSHTLGSVGRCEGVNLHTPKATPTLGYGIPVDSRNFIEWFMGQNSMACDVLHIIEKLLEHRCLKWVALLIWTYKKKLWPKEGSRVKLAIWLPTTKSQESTWFLCVQMACNISLENFQQGLQLCLRTHIN